MRNHQDGNGEVRRVCRDHGPAPYAVRICEAARRNTAFRAALWTGCHLQLTLMCIPASGEIGVETHPDTDQYIRVEEGCCTVQIGSCRDRLDSCWAMLPGDAVFVPAGVFHNIVNTGEGPLKLTSVYAPPQHPRGTLHPTARDAAQAEP